MRCTCIAFYVNVDALSQTVAFSLIMQFNLSNSSVGAFIATLQDLATLPENIVFYLRGYSEFISRLGPWHLRGRPGRDIPTAAVG